MNWADLNGWEDQADHKLGPDFENGVQNLGTGAE